MSPDLIFYLRLMPPPRGHFSHTVPALFYFCLPASLFMLWCFHGLLKWPIISLLPSTLQCRLIGPASRFTYWPASRLALVLGSILLGAATHLIWDDVTHGDGRAVELLPILRTPVLQLGPNTIVLYKVLQYVSTLGGGALLVFWAVVWLRSAPERYVEKRLQRSTVSKATWAVIIVGGTIAVGLLNGGLQLMQGGGLRRFVVGGVVGAVGGLFPLLMAFSIFWHFFDQPAEEFPEAA